MQVVIAATSCSTVTALFEIVDCVGLDFHLRCIPGHFEGIGYGHRGPRSAEDY